MLTDLEKLLMTVEICSFSHVKTITNDGITIVTVVDEGETFSTEMQDDFGIAFSNTGDCVAVGIIHREFEYWMSLYTNNRGVAI